MILSPDEDLEQTARHANPDEMIVVIAWPKPLKSINAQQARVKPEQLWETSVDITIVPDLMTKMNEATEDMMLMTILAMILKWLT